MGLGKGGGILRGGISLGGGNIRLAAAGTAALVGIVTALNLAPAKTGAQFSFSQKALYIGARIVGGPTLYTVLGGSSQGSIAQQFALAPGGTLYATQPGIAPFGWANQTTLAGGITLLVNGFIHAAHLPFYNQYVGPFIAALGLGLLIGGVVGGLLDPDPTGTPGFTPPALSNAPSAAPSSGGLAF